MKSATSLRTPFRATGLSRRGVLRGSAGIGLGAALGSRAGTRRSAAQDAGPASLTIWLDGEPGTVNAVTDILAAYAQEHPDTTVETTFVGNALFNPTLVPALNAGEGPDIWMGGSGPGQPQAIIEAGHALDLTPYYCTLGWNEIIPEEIVGYTSSGGKLWALGDSVETTLMFYNAAIFTEHGLEVPQTWADLMAACDTLRGAGFANPIGLGGADKYPVSWWQSLLWGRFAGPDGVNDVMFGEGSWNSEPFIQATAKLKEMNDAGCFGASPLAELQDDVEARYWRGDIPMIFTGPWVIGPGIDAVGDDIVNFGVFQVPPPIDGDPIYPSADIGTGWYINAATAYPDQAADVLNYLLFNEESRKVMLESGDNVPVGPLNLEGVDLPQIVQDVFALSNEYRDNGTIHAFLDTVTPASMTDVSYDGLQAVLAGQMTPEQFTESVQQAWEAARAEGEILAPGGVTCQ